MRYWWVNHKQTSRYEIAGGFLWSPMRKANGAENYFYNTMREASPGDLVISFSHAEIGHVGVVADFATPAPKPPSFGKAGDNWDKNNGWLLPVCWRALASPVKPKQKIEELREVLPNKYSPISLTTGNGNQGAYLAEVDKGVFKCLVGDVDFSTGAADLGALVILSDIDNAIEKEILARQDLDFTTKQRLVSARIGQGVFKERIYEFESSCRLTDVATSGLLIASHIKPWRLCNTSAERLDGANGLLLAPHVDHLFDRGLISFSNAGDVLVSSKLSVADLKLLGLMSACLRPGKDFNVRQIAYMEFHRSKVFLG
ncbi:HNH endonuclease [Pseudomonas cichorii]|uniref:HNH endonuclease n=1 Tax=Pseudomonas cichorii TaxID=36746 RepID=UPI0019109CCF|nr:HNH endonuclease signature motif containing protein [Pseudomonas cichorii]GFM79657.1 HNH endonuclease [Pseudomonas cichorii]